MDAANRNGEVTRLLSDVQRLDEVASGQLIELLRDELHSLAANMMRRQAAHHTLQATALVNEMYLRLADSKRLRPESRAHFLAIAARSMRQILGRHALERRSLKRGGAFGRVSFLEEPATSDSEDSSVALDAALEKLSGLDERQARVIEMRFFAGMTTDEIAEALSMSGSTVEREWRMARAWMRAELARTSTR